MTFHKKHIIILLSLILVSGLFFLIFLSFKNSRKQVCYKDKCFNVEVAKANEEQSKGLSGRKKLEDDSGMLFIFEEMEKYSFWMKNTLMSLDIIWIDENNKVVFIKENAKPCKSEICTSFTPSHNAKYVLEINGGKVKEIGLKVGDEINFSEDLR